MTSETNKIWEELNHPSEDSAAKGIGFEVMWKIFNTINHCLIAIISVVTIWLACRNTMAYLEWHVFLTTVGYQLLMAELIMSLSGENSWSHMLQNSTKKTIHGLLGCAGSILAIAGTALIIYNKSNHFTSNHGIIGLVALVFLVITALNGPMAYFATFLRLKKPVFIKICHYLTSILAFIFGITCLCLGYQKNWFKRKTSQEVVTTFIILSSITVCLTLRTPILNTIRLTRSIFRR